MIALLVTLSHLLAKRQLTNMGGYGCVSLLPKTELKDHYIKKYGMQDAGRQVFLELNLLQQMLEKYIL